MRKATMVVWWAAVWWLAVVCHGASAAADDPWAGVRKIVDGGVSSRVYPGAAAIVGTKNGIVFEHYAGRQTYGKVPPHSTTNQEVGEDTIFDLASLSKVVATTSVVAQLYENGLIDLGARVASAELLGEGFASGGKDGVTVEDCLLHQAGFPPDPSPNYWDPTFGCRGAPLPDSQSFACSERCYGSLLNQTLDASPGERYVYSDLSMITMMFVAGKVVESKGLVPESSLLPECSRFPNSVAVQLQCYFEAYLRTAVIPAIELASGHAAEVFGYRPLEEFWELASPTVTVAASKLNVTLQGRVEDGNAEMLGGVSGHAGVFATSRSVAALAHSLLFPGLGLSGKPSGYTFLNKTTVETFTTERDHSISSRALGWNTNDPRTRDEGWNLSCGDLLSPQTFMHLGYTGTMVCCDPEGEFYTVLLTNRVYPTDQGNGIHDVRRSFGDAAARVIRAGREEAIL